MPKQSAEPATANPWENPLERVLKVRQNLKGYPHANFIGIYIGLSAIVVFLLLASVAPQIGEKLGLLSERKQEQETFAKSEDRQESAQTRSLIKDSVKKAGASASDADVARHEETKIFPDSKDARREVKSAGSELNGRVVEKSSGKPLAGAVIVVEGSDYKSETKADDSGNYTIIKIPAGKYGLKASLHSYKSQKNPLVLPSGQVATVNFSLEH